AVAQETGKIIEQQIRWHFETAEELITLIHESLKVETFKGYHDEGLIIVDNLETLSIDERIKVKKFIETQTPTEMQFLITSRNSEEYETNYKLSGFISESGTMFIKSYSDENALDLELDDQETNELLGLSKGNTLVLVLSLKRLSQRLVNISGLSADYSSSNAWKCLKHNLEKLPPNAYEVISEFMFKDTFEQIEIVFANNADLFYKILRVFAVVQNGGIDLSTVCLLTQCSYPTVESAVDALCNFLIIEKKGNSYLLNQFAEKYIVGRFIPDAETFQKLSSGIAQRQRQIHDALEQLAIDIAQRPDFAKIMSDWKINTDSDRITAAKMYRIYGKVKRECDQSSKFKVESILEDFVRESKESEEITAHPFVKYQKARILQIVDRSKVLDVRHIEEILSAYHNAIYVIKTVEQYAPIQETKSYASLLWLFGQYLSDNNSMQDAIRYLEESKESFEHQNISDQEYYQCVTLLGTVYLRHYLKDRNTRVSYLRRARQISQQLYTYRNVLGKARKYALQLKSELSKYGDY
ncbi:MAG TPA: hypothetical protein DCW91_02330, partial [Acinetobacter nosocomialis]|nr:hypothetical protein [Acinetobacter nosocomialis]